MGNFDDLFDDDSKKQAGFNLRFGIEKKPDDAARDLELAKRYKLPPGVIAEYKPDYETKAKMDDSMATIEQSPKLRGWLASDKTNAEVSHDDLDVLSTVEKAAKYLVSAPNAPRGGLSSDVARAARSVASGAPSLSAGLYGGVASVAGLTDQFVQSLDDAAAWVTGTQRREILGTPGPESFFLGQQRSANLEAARWMGIDPAAGDTERAVMSGFQSAGSNLLTLPAGFARNGTNIMLGLMGTSVGGQSYGKGREAGLDPLRATSFAAQDATAEIVMERYFGAAGLLKNIKAGASAGKLFAYEVFKEVPGEVATTIWQNFNEWANVNPEKSLADFIGEQPEAIRDTIISTLVGGTSQIGAVKGLQRVLGGVAKEEEKANTAEQHAQVLESMQKTMEASKLLERSPETLASYAQELVNDGAENVYVDSSKLQGLDLTKLAQAVPSIASQLDQVQSGGDLVIPTSELLVGTIGTEFAQPLIDNARTDVNGMSRVEAKEYMATKGDALNAEIDRVMAEREGDATFKAGRDELQTKLHDELNAVGRFTPKVNEQYATLAANFYAVMAARTGMTVQQFADTYKLGFKADEVAGGMYDQQGKVATESVAFKNWFGDSKVVDAEGKPLVVYHGTAKAFTTFDQNKTMDGAFWFTSDKGAVDAGEVGAAGKGDIMPVYLSAKKLAGWDDYDKKTTDQLIQEGFDGVELDGDYMIFDPRQIKSVNNRGTFDPNDPNILNQSRIDGVAPVSQHPGETPLYEAMRQLSRFEESFQTTTSKATELADIAKEMTSGEKYEGAIFKAEPSTELHQGNRKPTLALKITLKNGNEVKLLDIFESESDKPFVVIGNSEAGQDVGGATAYQMAFAWAHNNGKVMRPDPAGLTVINRLRRTEAMVSSAMRYGTTKHLEPHQDQYVALLDRVRNGGAEPEDTHYSSRPDIHGELEALKAKLWTSGDSADNIASNVQHLLEASTQLTYAREPAIRNMEVADGVLRVRGGRDGALSLANAELADSSDAKEVLGVVLRPANTGVGASTLRRAAVTGSVAREVGSTTGLAAQSQGKDSDNPSPDVAALQAIRRVLGKLDTSAPDGLKGLFYQGEDKARGQIAFGSDITQQASIISLLKNADLSTFIHESGHFFLEVQADLASKMAARLAQGEQVSASEISIFDDFNKTLAWMGVKATPEMSALDHWAYMSAEEKRPYHEQWARGFEAYAFEGKSPNLELTKMFQTFRAWLVNVYRALLKSVNASNTDVAGALNVELSDEVRGVMDRMLATSDQIAEAEAARSMGPLFKSAEQAGMTVEEFKAYHDQGTQATMDAVDDLQAKGLRDMQWLSNAKSRKLKELQKQHDALRAQVAREVRAEVLSEPIYRAWTFLTSRAVDKVAGEKKVGKANGLNPEVDNLFEAIAKLGGLDRAEVKKLWGVGDKEKLESGVFGAPVLRKTGGLSTDAMAERLMDAGYLLPDANGKADHDAFEKLFDDQSRGVDRYSIQRDMAAAYGDAPLNLPDMPEVGFGKLHTEELRRRYGTKDDAVWRKLSALRMTSEDGGLDPDVVAELFGFGSGDELVKTLAVTEPPKSVIESKTDQRMLEEHGDLATPAGLERAADAAIHNDARAKFVSTELKALQGALSVRAKVPGQKNTVDVLATAAKDRASALIARLKVRDVRPAQYAAAEAREAKAAAASVGDIAKAATHKRNQLINMYAAKEAYAAQDEVKAALEYFRRVQTPGKIPAQHHDQIMGLLSKFDLRISTPLSGLDNMAQFRTWAKSQLDAGMIPPNVDKLLGPKQRAKFAEEVAKRNEDGDLIYPNEEDQALLMAGFIDQIEVRSYKEVTVEELRGLRDTIKQIEHIGRRTKRVLTDRKNREFEAVVAAMNDRIVSVAQKMGRKAGDTRSPNDTTGQERLSWRGFFFSHIKAANLLNIMDGGAGGPLWEHLMMTANDAANGEVVELAEASSALNTLLKDVKDLGKITDKAKHFPSIGRSLNRQARIVMALNMGNESNMQRLLGGEDWTLQQIKPVLDTLTAADWKFVQGMWDYYETFRPRVGAMEAEINGVEPEWVEARPLSVHTADGQNLELRGGYAPVIFDPRASGKAASYAAEKDAKAMMQAARVASTVSKSFTNARVEEVKGRPLLLSLDAMVGAVQDTVHYLHWQPWIIDANRMIKALDTPIRHYYGAEVVKQLRDWAGDNAAGMRPARDAAERKITALARNVSFAGLAFNVMSAVKQVTGYSQSVAIIGGKWMARGAARSIANPVSAYHEAVDKSSFMRKRATTRMRDLAEVNATVQDQGMVRKALDRGGYAMMMAMQTAVDVPTWWGAYEKAIDAGREEDMAIALADQAVIDAQGSGLQKDLASVERATGAIRLLTGFMSFMNTTANVNYRILRSDQGVGGKAVDLVLVNVIPVMMAVAIGALLTPGGDDDPEKLAQKYVVDQVGFMFGQFVGFREIQQLAAAAYGEPSGDYGGAVGLRMAGDILKVAKQVGQGEMDDAMRKAVINAAGDFVRIPSAQINRTITGYNALAEDETTNPAALAFGFQKQK
jgi:hypothetical protein